MLNSAFCNPAKPSHHGHNACSELGAHSSARHSLTITITTSLTLSSCPALTLASRVSRARRARLGPIAARATRAAQGDTLVCALPSSHPAERHYGLCTVLYSSRLAVSPVVRAVPVPGVRGAPQPQFDEFIGYITCDDTTLLPVAPMRPFLRSAVLATRRT